MKLAGWMWMAALPLLAQPPGITPRPTAADYAAHAAIRGMTLAAALVPAADAKKIFANDLKGYLVFEVAIYPDKDSQPEVTPADFMLRTMRASEPSVVAASVLPYPPPPAVPSKVQVYTESTIGYESGPYHRGVYTGTSVGVGVGNPPVPPPPPSGTKDRQRYDLEMILGAKALPAGRITQPIAGYLYFPKPTDHKKGDPYQLNWYGPEAMAHLNVKP